MRGRLSQGKGAYEDCCGGPGGQAQSKAKKQVSFARLLNVINLIAYFQGLDQGQK
jgi:hypothetical protein